MLQDYQQGGRLPNLYGYAVRPWRTQQHGENYPVSYDIQVSTNGTDWTTIVGETSSGGTAGCAEHGVTTCGRRHSHAFAPTQARYVRLSVHSWVSARTGEPASGYGWALREFEVYAPAAARPTATSGS
ncbi:discoidin domain-containing protein [Streptomyces sp. NPDC056194]|uniref:discoidin domain-containing protein n=1 Tax=unclassified Streptomyces TaxID=2593676 RepID=UPI0035D59A24